MVNRLFIKLVCRQFRDKCERFKKIGNSLVNQWFFSIFVLVFGLSSVTAWAAKSKTVVEIPTEMFNFKDVPPLTDPVKIELKNGEVDLSAAKKAFQRIKKSQYYSSFQGLETRMVSKAVKDLCNSLKPQKRRLMECLWRAEEELDLILENIYKESAALILYLDEDYNPPGSAERIKEAKDYFEQAEQLLSSTEKCGIAPCGNSHVSKALRLASEAEYAHLYDKIKNKDKTCQKKAVQGLASEFFTERLPKKCLEVDYKNHPVCANKLKDLSAARQRVLALIELAYGPLALTATAAEPLCIACANKDTGSLDVGGLYDLIDTLKKPNQQCGPFKPGDERIVHSSTIIFPVAYPMKRHSDGSYSAHFTLKFSADKDYDGPVRKSQVHGHYLSKVKECMKKANQAMLGPNGEKLRIVIKGPEESLNSCDAANAKEIKIGSKDTRSSVHKYAPSVPCSTIVHEVLHLTGLCDEYQERAMGFYTHSKTGEVVNSLNVDKTFNPSGYEFQAVFDCRVTSGSSIMASPHQKWTRIFQTSHSQRGQRVSLLTGMQFNHILYGDCSGKHSLFDECSKLAYRSSMDDESCLDKKQRCEEQNSMGFDKQKEMKRLEETITVLEGGLKAASAQRDRDWANFNETIASVKNAIQEKEKQGESASLDKNFLNEIEKTIQQAKREGKSPAEITLEDKLQELRNELETVKRWP